MDGVGVPKKIVQVAQNLLIGAHQKRRQDVRLAVVDRMQRERALDVAAVDELVDLTVGIARNIAQYRIPRRHFVESMDGHDWKELLDSPTVGHALKEAEVAEIGVRQHAVERFQLLGEVLQFFGHALDAAADAKVQFLGQAALCKRQVAEAEQVERRVERLLRVVKGLEQVF